jgi:hypothetical protein
MVRDGAAMEDGLDHRKHDGGALKNVKQEKDPM